MQCKNRKIFPVSLSFSESGVRMYILNILNIVYCYYFTVFYKIWKYVFLFFEGKVVFSDSYFRLRSKIAFNFVLNCVSSVNNYREFLIHILQIANSLKSNKTHNVIPIVFNCI